MKKYVINFFLLFFTFFLFSCNSEEDYITDNDYLNQNNIQDVVRIYGTSDIFDSIYLSTTDEVLMNGIRDNKFWFAVFKKDSKKLVNEWFCTMPGFNNGLLYGSATNAAKINNGCYVFQCPPLNGGYGTTIYFLGENNQAKLIYKTEDWPQLAFANEVVIGLGLSSTNNECTILNTSGDVLIDSANAESGWHTALQEKKEVLFSKMHDDSLTIFALKLKNQHTTYATYKDKFNRNIQIDHGFGEIENIYIKRLIIGRNHLFDNGGLCEVHCYYGKYDMSTAPCVYEFNEKGIKIKFKLSHNDQYKNLFTNWYNGSVLVLGKYVVDTNCQQLFKFAHECNPDYIDFIVPISYTNTISFSKKDKHLYIRCMDEVNYNLIWKRTIDKFEGFFNEETRLKYTLLLEEEVFLKIHIKAVNYDGSKLEFDFLVDKSTGEITYL